MLTDKRFVSVRPPLEQAVPPPHVAALVGVPDLLPRYAFVNLRPGELIITDQPTIVATLLGSCISICLYHPRRKIGGMCHCLLPADTGTQTEMSPYSFVNDTLNHMIEVLVHDYRVPLAEIKVKLFGGANVLHPRQANDRKTATIGLQNIEAARAIIRRHGLEITSQRVGGDNGYKLFFNTQTGEVFLRMVTGRVPEKCA